MKQRSILRVWLSVIGLMLLTGVASAQASLVFTEAASGRRVEFTPFGTLVFQQQNLVSGAWRINYQDRSGSYSAGYFNRQLNSGVETVSLTANFPSGQVLNTGERLYISAVMRTLDGKLTITRRFIWDAGKSTINSVLTYENTSRNPVDVNNVIIWRLEDPPALPAETCPYIPPPDNASASNSLVVIGGVRYIRTNISFTTPPLQPSQSRDVPTAGCDGGRDPGANVPG